MTGRRAVALAVVAAFVVVLSAPRLLPARRDRHSPPIGGPRPGVTTTAGPVAAGFVTALTDIDMAHPHGDLAALRRLATTQLASQLAATPALPALALHAGFRQRGVVTSLAVSARDAEHAVALVDASLTEDTTPPMRTAASYTVTLTRVAGTWLVTGVGR